MLVLANETADSEELLDELRRIGADTAATYFVVVPASPIETGAAATHGPLDVQEATQQAAQERLDHTLSMLRSENLDADGALGDQRPLRALADAVDSFHPDQIVIATLPPEFSVWHRFDVVDRARAQHGLPVTHVVATRRWPLGPSRCPVAGYDDDRRVGAGQDARRRRARGRCGAARRTGWSRPPTDPSHPN